MAGEQEAIAEAPATEAAPSPIEPEADEPRKVEDPQPSPAAEMEGEDIAPAPDPEDDLEEFEWNGKPIKAPKGLKDGVLMHSDYTRKTQEVAAQRKELEATAKRVQEQARSLAADVEKRAEYISVSKQLEQYSQIDWRTWIANDPVAAQQGQFEYQELQRQQNVLAQELQQRATKRTEEAQQAKQQDLAKRLQETQEFARREIKGWTPETDKKVVDFALAQGVDFNDLQAAMNPTIYKVLYLAELGQQLLNKPAAKPKAPQPVPLETVGAKSSPPARKTIADMNMDEYAAYRKKQMGARG